MRRQLTTAFVLVGVIFIATFATVRAVSLGNLVREQTREHLDHDAALIGLVFSEHASAGLPVSDTDLRGLVDDDQRAVVSRDDAPVATYAGAAFRADVTPLSGTASAGPWTVVLEEDPAGTSAIVRSNVRDLVLVSLAMLVITSLIGSWLAARLSRPFHQLARAAEGLGRGRFELELPSSRLPEVQAIAAALEGTARSLEEDLLRDSEVLAEASHEIRSPLTSLRMELEDWTSRDDLPGDVRAGATRGLAQVDRVDSITGGLIAHTRRRGVRQASLHALVDVARGVVDHWVEELSSGGVRVFVEGDPEVRLPAGQLEQVLDHVLLHVQGADAVRLTFVGEAGQVRVTVLAEGAPDPGPDHNELARAAELARAVGGVLSGDPFEPDGLQTRLPLR